MLRYADGCGGCISGKVFKLLNLRSPWGCISGNLFILLNLRSPRDCGSCRPLYSNHATDRPATCAHSSEVASMVADFYGAIQMLRNGGGGCLIFWKKALRRCNVHITPHEGVGGGPISRKKALRNT